MNNQFPMSPIYEHDCSDCVFLGNYNGQDLYYHKTHPVNLVNRYGDLDTEVISGLGFYNVEPQLTEAAIRAVKLGMITEQYLIGKIVIPAKVYSKEEPKICED